MTGEIWTFSEQKDSQLREISFELLAWGRKLADVRGSALCAIVLANSMSAEEIDRLIQHGADKIYLIQNPAFAHFLVEPQAHTMQYLVKEYQPEVILAGATTTGRTVMPYLSMLLHTGLTADCTGLEIEAETGNLLQIRPAIGGNIMATIKTPNTRPQMSTVRPKSILALTPDPSRRGEIIFPVVPEKSFHSRMRFEKSLSEGRGNAILEEADIVISGGLGLAGSRSNRDGGKPGGCTGSSNWFFTPTRRPRLAAVCAPGGFERPDYQSRSYTLRAEYLVLSSIWQVSRQQRTSLLSTAIQPPQSSR